MALHTFGTAGTTSLNAIKYWPGMGTVSSDANHQMALADAQAIDASMFSTSLVGAFNNQKGSGILFTATTHSNTTLDTFSAVSGPPLSAIVVGALIRGVGIPPNTYVQAKSPATGTPTSITLSQAATAGASGVNIIAVNPLSQDNSSFGFDPSTGRVTLPDGRGYIQLYPGDVIAIDNAGAVVVVPANSVSYAGSLWVYT